MPKKLPRHRVDATPVYVRHHLYGEDAWDVERIEKEVADAEAENERRDAASEAYDPTPREDGAVAAPPTEERIDLSEHPFAMYMSGQTRFDIDAPVPWRGKRLAASDYFKAGAQPVRFILRRLRWREYHQVMSIHRTGDKIEAYLRACQYGLVEVENGRKLGLDLNPDAAERSDDDMQALFEAWADLPVFIGQAVMAASVPLTDAEKKA